MLTIQNYEGKTCYLSDEIYEILTDHHPSHNHGYSEGDLVRLISDPYYSDIPGYHHQPGWVTVCSIFAQVAGFCGFKRSELRCVGSGAIYEPKEG